MWRGCAAGGGGGLPASGGSDGSGLPLLIATALSIRTSSAASRWCSMLRSVATSRVSSIAEESSERLARVWICERGGAARRRRRVRRRDDARVGARVCDELLRARTHLVQQHEEQEAQRAT